MNKKIVTLLSVAVLSAVASGVSADEFSLGGSVATKEDNAGLVVSEQPKEDKPAETTNVSNDNNSLDLGDKSEKEPSKDNTGVVVEPTTPSEQPKEDKPSETLGKDTEKEPSKDNTGLVVSEQPKVDQPKEDQSKKEQPKEDKPKADTQKEDDPKVKEDKKKAEDNVGVKESDIPKPLNVTKQDIQEKPIETNTGYTVVSTNQGKVVVEEAKGDYVEKEPYEIGAVKQSDGTIALKDKDGELKVLPNTGSVGTIFASIWGFVGLVATIIGKRKFN